MVLIIDIFDDNIQIQNIFALLIHFLQFSERGRHYQV